MQQKINFLPYGKHSACVTKQSQLILINKFIAFCSKKLKIPASALCGQTVESFSVNSSDIYIVTTAL